MFNQTVLKTSFSLPFKTKLMCLYLPKDSRLLFDRYLEIFVSGENMASNP
jgi:hypothetical protein